LLPGIHVTLERKASHTYFTLKYLASQLSRNFHHCPASAAACQELNLAAHNTLQLGDNLESIFINAAIRQGSQKSGNNVSRGANQTSLRQPGICQPALLGSTRWYSSAGVNDDSQGCYQQKQVSGFCACMPLLLGTSTVSWLGTKSG